jgi:hypothetical protein
MGDGVTAYQCDRDGKMFWCPACGRGMRSSPSYDPGPFCSRKVCIKRRAKQVQEDMEKEREQGGPAN